MDQADSAAHDTRAFDDRGDATFRLTAPRDKGFVTIRVKATDAGGNTIDQTITRAWKVE